MLSSNYIVVDDLLKYEIASAVTRDRTQEKRISLSDGRVCVVRRYLVEEEEYTVYSGFDAVEAIRIYNGLS